MEEIGKKFSELLEELRQDRQISKKDLATRAGLTPGYVSHLTRGERSTPSLETVEALADALRLDAETKVHFYEVAGQPSPQVLHNSSGLSYFRLEDGESKAGYSKDDWGEAPNVQGFYGRAENLKQLEHWIVDERCQMVAILGMGGVGKTMFAAKMAEQLHGTFEYIFWRSLQNTPRIESILRESIQFFSEQQRKELPRDLDGQIALLLTLMRRHRCLMVLDNVESLLQGSLRAGQYKEGYEGYGKLFYVLGDAKHRSCVLLTSREKPKEISRLEGKTLPVRSMQLPGISEIEGRAFLEDKGLFGSDMSWTNLIRVYSGNLLALKLVSESIHEVFGGDVAAFLERDEIIFGDIRELLRQQFQRLSELEQTIMYWLAIERDAVSLEDLQKDLLLPTAEEEMLLAIGSLRRRSMIETGNNARYTLQAVIMEHLTDDIIDKSREEIRTEKFHVLWHNALMKAQTKDYLRNSQISLIVKPLLKALLDDYSKKGCEKKFKAILSSLREAHAEEDNYVAGNLLNLLVHLDADLRYYNFSHLVVRQAYLQGVNLPDVNFAGADLEKSVFTDTFGSILSAALSRDGKLLAIGTANGEVRLLEAVTGRSLRIYEGHFDCVRSVAFNSDSTLLASGSDDQTVRLWETATERCVRVLEGHESWIWAVSFSPDGKMLASGSDNQNIYLWDVNSGRPLKMFAGHEGKVYTVSFSPDGKMLASGSEDQTIRLWMVTTGECLETLVGHTGWIWSLAFSPDGILLVTGSEDQTIRLWQVATGQSIKTLTGHTGWVRSVSFSPDGKQLASGSEDQTIRLWEVNSGQCLKIIEEHSSRVKSVVFSPDSQTLFSSSEDQTVRLWEVSTGRCIQVLQGYSNRVRAVTFNPEGTILASGSEDQTVHMWEFNSGRSLRTLSGHTSWIRSVAFNPEGTLLASGSEDQTIRLWEVNTGYLVRTLIGHTHRVRSVAFNPEGTLLASGSEDQTIRLWEVNSGQCIGTLTGHNSRVWSVAFSPDGNLIVSGGDDQTVRFWEVGTGRCIDILREHESRIYSVDFSPDGTLVASGSGDHTARLWEVGTGRCVSVLQGHTSWVYAVAFSPDGLLLASGSDDETVRLWEISTGRCVGILTGHKSWIYAVAFNLNGSLASGSDDGTIKIWNVKQQTCIATFRGERPYERMNILNAKGLSEIRRSVLITLGAVEEAEL
ncbi:MAG: helix-turn-helix domain-containing protein [Ktedonobacteraceae bacterium]|nr:helix-turn-helix domain-containing protein [Ktedonobacteraceae bacterium]